MVPGGLSLIGNCCISEYAFIYSIRLHSLFILTFITICILITGGKGCNPESVAKAMFSGFKHYINSSGYKSILKSIRIVIFQADMVKKFVKASEDTRPRWSKYKGVK